MSNFDVFHMAIRNLFKRKLRSFLTIFGVIIGACSIVVMISFRIGMNKTLIESLSRMSDLLTVQIYYYDYGMGRGSDSGGGAVLNDAAIESFRALPGVVTATAFVDQYVQAVSGKQVNGLQLRGIDPEAAVLMGYTMKEGTLFTGEQKYEAVFGYNPPFEFYNPRDRNREWSWWSPWSEEEDTRVPTVDIFNDRIQFSYDWSFGSTGRNFNADPNRKPVKPYTLNTVGWIDYNGNTDYYVLMPIDDVLEIKYEAEKWQNEQYQQGGGTGNKNRAPEGYNNAVVKFADINFVEEGLNTIKSMGFEAYGMVESLRAQQDIMNSIQMLLAAVGGVALFVSAIGIANTMIMSIYERTKEIGVMKVIGATLNDIGRLFLVEAALIGLIGGILGVGISYAASAIVNNVGISAFDAMSYGMSGGDISEVPPWLALAGIAGAVLMGTLSGFFPALRAMRLSALAAIRAE